MIRLLKRRNVIGTNSFHLASVGVPTRGFNTVAMTCIEDHNEVALDYSIIMDKVTSECRQNVVSSGRLIEQYKDVLMWHSENA